MDGIPGCEGSIGPFPNEYAEPHVYARDVTSGAGNCVCGCALGDELHVEAAPGVPVPEGARPGPSLQVCKTVEEQRFLLGVAYQAGPELRIAKGADGARDFFTAAELEKAAWSFMRSGPHVGAFHMDGTEGAATPVETFIWRWGDLDCGDGIVVKSGDWLIGSVLDPPAWDMYKRGLISGYSPQGVARRRRVSRGS
jgi:hypothetical protein